VVDVTLATDGSYETIIMYSCRTSLGLPSIRELVFATRSKDVSDQDIAAMQSRAKERGITWDSKDLKRVDQSKCDDRVKVLSAPNNTVTTH